MPSVVEIFPNVFRIDRLLCTDKPRRGPAPPPQFFLDFLTLPHL